MATFPGWVTRSAVPWTTALSIRFLTISYADVVGAVDVEPLLVEPEPDRERRVLDEDQVRRLERDRQADRGADGRGPRSRT